MELAVEIATIIGAVVGAAGLVAVAYELRALSRSLGGGSSAATYSYMLQLLGQQIEHPELRQYVYAGAEPPADGIEAHRVAAFLAGYADFLEFILGQRRLGLLPEHEYRHTWEPFVSRLLATSQGLRNYILGYEDFYAPELVGLAESHQSPDSDGRSWAE